MIKQLLEKWACKHKWKKHAEVAIKPNNVLDFTTGELSTAKFPSVIRQTLICQTCGKIKKIKL